MSVRLLTAAAVLVSGAVRLKLWFDGFRYEDVVGPAFMVNAVAGLVIAVLLLWWRHWVPLFLAVGFGASTLGTFLLATTAGLFGRTSTGRAPTCGPPRCGPTRLMTVESEPASPMAA